MSREQARGSFLTDENNKRSSGRLAFFITLAFALWMIYKDSEPSGWDVPDAAYVLLGSLFTLEVLWTAGTRGLDKLSDAFSGFAAIAAKIGMRVAGKKDEE